MHKALQDVLLENEDLKVQLDNLAKLENPEFQECLEEQENPENKENQERGVTRESEENEETVAKMDQGALLDPQDPRGKQ